MKFLSCPRTSTPGPGTPSRASQSAFTLLETLAVLTIGVILAAIVAENVLQRVKTAGREAEGTTLTTIASTLRAAICLNKSIPAVTNWAQTAATYLSLPVNKVTTTAAGQTRLLLIDPNFRVGTNASQTLPFTQTRDGSIQPVSPRVIMLSSLAGPLPSITVDTNTFTALWNTLPGAVPSGWPSAWANRGEDLRILRLDWGNILHRILLENLDMYNAAPYSIESTNNLAVVPAGTRKEMWFIDTTAINFHLVGNTLQGREYIVEDASYTFENGKWRRYLWTGSNNYSTGWFGQMVDQFLAAPPPPGMTRRYSNQQWVIDAMYTFLYDFGQWSIDNFTGGPPWPHIPGYEQANAGSTGLSSYSSDLIYYY